MIVELDLAHRFPFEGFAGSQLLVHLLDHMRTDVDLLGLLVRQVHRLSPVAK